MAPCFHTDYDRIHSLAGPLLFVLSALSLVGIPILSATADEGSKETAATVETKKLESMDFVLVNRDAFLYIHPDTQTQSARDRFHYRDHYKYGTHWVFRLIKEHGDWLELETIADTTRHCYHSASGLRHLKLRLFAHHRYIGRTIRQSITHKSSDGTMVTVRPGVELQPGKDGFFVTTLPGFRLQFPASREMLTNRYQAQSVPEKDSPTHILQSGAQIRFSASGLLTVTGISARELAQRARSGIDLKVRLTQDSLRPPVDTESQESPALSRLPVTRVKVLKDPRRTRVVFQDQCVVIEGDVPTLELKEIGAASAEKTNAVSPTACHIRAGAKLTWPDGSPAGTTRFDQPVDLGPQSKENCFRLEVREIQADHSIRPASSLKLCFNRDNLICPEPKPETTTKRKKK